MIILAVDTSSAQGIVALKSKNNAITVLKNTHPLEHNRFILPAIDTLLQQAGLKLSDIDYFAAAVGPGSFVGTRLAVAVIQGLAFGNHKPAVAVSHLALIAEAYFDAYNTSEVTVKLDARMQGFYQGTFHQEKGLIGEEAFYRFAEQPPEFTQIPLFEGNHLIKLVEQKIIAGKVLHDPAMLQPVYLHDEGNWKKQQHHT